MNQTYQIKQTLCSAAAHRRLPVSGSFELTPRCNFSCKMCYVRMSAEEMTSIGRERTTEQWLDIARQAVDEGLVFLLLTGGEPLLRPDFTVLYRELTNMGLSISINTNGYLLNDTIRQLFTELPPALVNVTLYGTTPDSYYGLCGVRDAFERVTDNILWLKNKGISINLNATITPWNIADLKGIYEFAQTHSIPMRPTFYNFPPVRRADQQEFQRFDPETVGKLLAQDMLIQHGPEEIKKMVAAFGTAEAIAPGCGMEQGDHMVCYAGRSQFWISWNGDMVACGMLNEPTVHPFEIGFKTAWDELAEKTAAITLCPDCTGCPHSDICTKCAAVTSAETGRFDGKPTYMCHVTESYCTEMHSLANL